MNITQCKAIFKRYKEVDGILYPVCEVETANHTNIEVISTKPTKFSIKENANVIIEFDNDIKDFIITEIYSGTKIIVISIIIVLVIIITWLVSMQYGIPIVPIKTI